MTPDELDWARSLIAGARWQYASSVPEAPHEYSVDWWSDPADFARFAALIASYGRREKWRDGYTYTYLAVDGLRYWVTPAVFGSGWIVNRARIPTATPDPRPQLPGLEDER